MNGNKLKKSCALNLKQVQEFLEQNGNIFDMAYFNFCPQETTDCPSQPDDDTVTIEELYNIVVADDAIPSPPPAAASTSPTSPRGRQRFVSHL